VSGLHQYMYLLTNGSCDRRGTSLQRRQTTFERT